MLPGLRDTPWPARLAIFAALVGHAFAPRPLEAQPRALAAARTRPDRALPPARPPAPEARIPAGAPAEPRGEVRATPIEREVEREVEPPEQAPADHEHGRAGRNDLRLTGFGGAAATAPTFGAPLGARRADVAAPAARALPGLSWRLEGRARFGLQLGRVRDLGEEPRRREEIPPGFGLRAVVSF